MVHTETPALNTLRLFVYGADPVMFFVHLAIGFLFYPVVYSQMIGAAACCLLCVSLCVAFPCPSFPLLFGLTCLTRPNVTVKG